MIPNAGPEHTPSRIATKVLFLDFDGVLNHREWLVSQGDKLMHDAHHFDPKCVSLLNEIVDQTTCKVIVSSSWRIIRPLDQLQFLLDLAGFTHVLSGVTPSTNGCRGDDITLWIEEFSSTVTPVTNICILDDDSDMGTLKDKLVQTSFLLGLQPSHASRAIEMLNHS